MAKTPTRMSAAAVVPLAIQVVPRADRTTRFGNCNGLDGQRVARAHQRTEPRIVGIEFFAESYQPTESAGLTTNYRPARHKTVHIAASKRAWPHSTRKSRCFRETASPCLQGHAVARNARHRTSGFRNCKLLGRPRSRPDAAE